MKIDNNITIPPIDSSGYLGLSYHWHALTPEENDAFILSQLGRIKYTQIRQAAALIFTLLGRLSNKHTSEDLERTMLMRATDLVGLHNLSPTADLGYFIALPGRMAVSGWLVGVIYSADPDDFRERGGRYRCEVSEDAMRCSRRVVRKGLRKMYGYSLAKRYFEWENNFQKIWQTWSGGNALEDYLAQTPSFSFR